MQKLQLWTAQNIYTVKPPCLVLALVHLAQIIQCYDMIYCHTRPGGKTYPIPKGSKDGPKSGIIFISDPASHPASHPDRLTSQNIQSGITHQPLVESSSSFKLKHREPNQNWNFFVNSFKWRWPPMEDDLKIFKEIKNSKSGISQQPLIGSN